jgi:histidine kinase
MSRQSKPAWRALRVGGALLVFSVLWYVMVFLIVRAGHVDFYSVVEQALLFAYCLASYGACWLCDRAWASPRIGRRRFWAPLVASYAVAALATTAIFLGMRVGSGRPVPWLGVLVNVPFTLLMFHSVIAGTFFASRHFEERTAAVAAQAAAEQAAMRAQLRWLQQQVDPHFLFNSLSILTSLVRESPAEAEAFCHHLAHLYRYVVRHNQDEWVALDEELRFVESYVHLLQARFGGAYRVTIALPRASTFFVVPGLLQELLNNAVKHNQGSDEQPVEIALRAEDDALLATNPLRPKRHAPPASGQGLKVLSERYRLQAGRPLEWRRSDGCFEVKVPLVEAP